MRISDWSSDVCSSDLLGQRRIGNGKQQKRARAERSDQQEARNVAALGTEHHEQPGTKRKRPPRPQSRPQRLVRTLARHRRSACPPRLAQAHMRPHPARKRQPSRTVAFLKPQLTATEEPITGNIYVPTSRSRSSTPPHKKKQ